MAGASEESSRLTLTTGVEIQVQSPCEFTLSLKDTRLAHSDGNNGLKAADSERLFGRELQSSPLRFSFQDGVIDHICPDDSEKAWSLNIKKGILSAFQTSMKDYNQAQNVTETDVLGECKTEYSLVSNGYYSTTIKKVKDALSCVDHLNYRSMWQATPYRMPSDIQTLPIMKTNHECQQVFESNGLLQSTECEESHVYRPFSNGQSGGSTVVKQTLKYNTYTRSLTATPNSFSKRSTLTFDHAGAQTESRVARRNVEKKLNEMCRATKNDIRPETPAQFADLVTAMRGMDADDMEAIFRKLRTRSMCNSNNRVYKFYVDALPVVSTKASVKLMSSLLVNEDVTGIKAKAWMTSLAFIQHPTSDMIAETKALIDSKTTQDDALLPVTSLINNFCKTTSTCENDYAVISIVSSLEKKIGYSCDASGKDFDLVLRTIRAIGNAGHSSRGASALNKCMKNTYNPIEVRVAAAEAFRRMPCDVEDSDLWNVIENTDLDSELRISAYLALMRCPSDLTLSKMAMKLSSESNEHVGSFIYSHLTNLRETSDPHKQDVARAIDNLALDKEFDLNPLKFSRNYETSFLLNKVNTGLVADANLIWSSQAQLPRAVSANLTVDLFGQAINLLDFGGRLEGMEYLIKNMLGPYMEGDKEKNKVSADDIQGSLYGRMFGNELLFAHTKTFKQPFSNKWLDLLIKSSKKQEFSTTQSAEFIDVSMVIPSVAGLPINVDVNTMATVDLQMSGKADIRKLGTPPRTMDVDGEIRPSAAVEVTGALSVDAFVAKTGLRMRNTMHSSTILKGRLQIDRSQQINFELDLPRDKIEFFDARSKFFIIHNDRENEQAMITDNRKDKKVCTGSTLSEITGLELCTKVSFPNASMITDSPYFPLTGPSSFSVTLHKKDTHSGYKFFAKKLSNKKMTTAQISFNTPGSQVDRAILMDLTVNNPKKQMDATLSTPWKKAVFRGSMMNLKDMKSLTGNVVVDDTNTYSWTSEVKIEQTKSKLRLSPMIEIRQPNTNNVQLTGFVTVEKPMKALDVDLSLSGVSTLPMNLKTSLNNNNKEKSVVVSFSPDSKTDYSLQASHQLNLGSKKSFMVNTKNSLQINTPERQLVDLSGNIDYRAGKSVKLDGSANIHKLMKKPASVKVTLLQNSKKRGVRYDLDGLLKSSFMSGKVDSNLFAKSSGFMSTKTILNYNIPKISKDTVVLSGKYNDRSTKAYNKYSLRSNVEFKKNPDYNLGLLLNADHKQKHSQADVELKYGSDPKSKTKRIYVLTNVNRKIKNLQNVDIDTKLVAKAPEYDVDLSMISQHSHSPKSLDTSIGLSYGKGKDIKAGVVLKNKSNKLKNYNGKATLSWPQNDYILNSAFTQTSQKQYTHSINLKNGNGMKHSIENVYKFPESNSYGFSSNVNLDNQKPVNIEGSVALDPKDFDLSGQVKSGSQKYGINANGKLLKSAGKINMEVVHPNRRLTFIMDGKANKNKYDTRLEASWDADNKDSKVTFDGSSFHKEMGNSLSMGGNFHFNSPFENFENILSNMKFSSDKSQHDFTGKLSWGGKSEQIQTSINVKKPFTLNNMDFSIGTKTPFKGFRSSELSVSHKYDDSLNTQLKGTLEKESVKLAVQGKDLSDGYKNHFTGNLALKSTLKNYKSMNMKFNHKCSKGNVNTNGEFNKNGKVYSYDLNMDHSLSGWDLKNSGDLTILVPRSKIATNWEHASGSHNIKSTLTSNWNDKRMYFDVSGTRSHDMFNLFNGNAQIQTPWKPVRDIAVFVFHKDGTGLIDHKVEVKQSGRPIGSSVVNYKRGYNTVDFDFNVETPVTPQISGKINSDYRRYPSTGSAELQWAPRRKITVEGSVNPQDFNNAEMSMKVTTPFRELKNINIRASNKKEGDETVSHMNLDYGVRKNIDLETRLACNDKHHLARVKLSTPFETIKTLDTGFRFDGESSKFDSVADFELIPHLGRFQASANWEYITDMSGKIRLDTPFAYFPYFQLTTLSQNKGRGRQSHIEAEMYPRKLYSFDANYVLVLPISIEANIHTPHPEFDGIGLIFQHNHGETVAKTHSEVKYQNDKQAEMDFNADWSNGIEGSLIVKTPFVGYENSKISLTHTGDIEDFKTRGEIDIVQKSVVADAAFKYGYRTSGSFVLTSPVNGYETIKATVFKKGKLHNLKGEATFSINSEKYQSNVNNKYGDDSLKFGISIDTPHTQTLKFAIDHNGPIERFTNKLSASYGRKNDIDLISSLDVSTQDISGNGQLVSKLDGRTDTYRVVFNKNGPINDMTFSGTASENDYTMALNGNWNTINGLDTSLNLNYPSKFFDNIGLSANHKGNWESFKSSGSFQVDNNKLIDGEVALTQDGFRKIRFDSKIATIYAPLELTEVSVSHDFNEYSTDLSGYASVHNTRIGENSIKYSKTGDWKNLALNADISHERSDIAIVKIANNFHNYDLHSSFELITSFAPEVTLTFDHSGEYSSCTTSAKGQVGRSNIVSLETSFNKRGDAMSANGQLTYSLPVISARNTATLKMNKEGEMNDIKASIEGKLSDQTVTIDTEFKNKDSLAGSLTIRTPVEGYSSVGGSFKHTGNIERFNCEGTLIVADNKEFSTKVDFYRYLLQRIEATVELNTPITGYEFTKYEYRHEGESNSFNCYSTLQYGNSKRIIYEMKASTNPKPDFIVTLKTPFNGYQEMLASASYLNKHPKYGFSGKVDGGNGLVITLNGDLDLSREMTGALDVTTPYRGFKTVGLSFQSSGKTNKGSITYMDGKTISGETNVDVDRYEASAELKTPFDGLKFTKSECRSYKKGNSFMSSCLLIYGDSKTISVDTEVMSEPKTGFSINLKTPFEDYENLEAAASFEKKWQGFEYTSRISSGYRNTYILKSNFDASGDITGSVDIETPMYGYEKIGGSFKHSGDSEKFSSEGIVTYAVGKVIKGKINFYIYMLRRLQATVELATPFEGIEMTKAEASFEDKTNSISTGAALEYGYGKKLNGNVKLTYSPNYDIVISVNTPFSEFESMKFEGGLDIVSPSYSANCALSSGYSTWFSTNGKLNIYSIENVDGVVEVSVPNHFAYAPKLEYQHKVEASKMHATISHTCVNGKEVQVEFTSVFSPNFDTSLTVKTPFENYETLGASASYDKSYNKYDAAVNLNLGNKMQYSMTSGLDYTTEPLRAFTRVSTPCPYFRTAEVSITHEGTLNDFKSTALFSTPSFDNVNAEASWKYNQPFDMSMSGSVKSSYPGYDDLRVELKNSEIGDEKKTHAVIGWTADQQITGETVFKKQNGWYKDSTHADVSLTTPFIAVRSLALQMDHVDNKQVVDHKIGLELNGDQLLDMDASYTTENKRKAEVNFRRPWPMTYTVSANTESGVTDAEFYANWDKNSRDANVRVQANLADKSDDYQLDKSMDVAVISAARTMGLKHVLTSTSQKTASQGKIYWNDSEDSKVFYELDLQDNSRRGQNVLDSLVKLGLPSRTLALTGSLSDKTVSQSADVAFKWDADKDDTKQVGVKGTLSKGEKVRGDITLSLPAIRKEIRVDGEVSLKNGKVILDTKTDISYSKDNRKTLTLVSKIEDISGYYSNYNYSMELGVRHPFTNTDLSMKSHIGSSDERMTVGFEANYLTAKRQEKNIALLSEINTLKKQISLQLRNPSSNMEVVGNVISTSPYKVAMKSKINEQEILRSDLTLDSYRKSLVVNTVFEGDNGLTFTAKYPNSTAFRADVTYNSRYDKREEALLAARLNTSRLLHTRLHWRPEAFRELQSFINERSVMAAEKSQVFLHELNQAVGEELSDKYYAYSRHFRKELKPVLDILERELALISEKMEALSQDLKVMYERNDFHLKMLGDEMTDYYMALQENLVELNTEYVRLYKEIISSLSQGLKDMQRFPIHEYYHEKVSEYSEWLAKKVDESLDSLEEFLARVDKTITSYKTSFNQVKKQALDTVYNHTYVNYLSNKINQITDIDLQPYMSSMRMPESYTAAIYSAHDTISSGLGDFMNRPEISYINHGVNEMYQQGKWAYHYWQLEENIRKHTNSILEGIRDIIKEELKEYTDNLQTMSKNPITVWDPAHGEIQAEIPLPIDVKRLDELPDYSPLVNKAEKIVAKYLPDQSTWDNIQNTMVDYLPAPKPEDDITEINNSLIDIPPRKNMRKNWGMRRRNYAFAQM